MIFKCESTEIDLSITYQSKLTVILLDDKYLRGPRVHQQRHMTSGKKIRMRLPNWCALFNKSERKLYNELDDRFG